MLKEFRVVLASPPDRERVVAEIWHGGEMWAEVANENDHLTIEIYPRTNNHPWIFDYAETLEVIRTAKEKLFDQKSGREPI